MTATKCRRVGRGIGRVKHRAVNRHQAIAPKEGSWHLLRLCQHLTAFVHQGLQAVTAQGLAPSAQGGVAQLAFWLAGMQGREFAHQFVPDQASG